MRALVSFTVSFVLVAFTVVFQLTVVDRIAFPGGAGPDLVLLVVAALALAGGPMAGVLTGFWAGLALDVAPPGSHFTGQNALVFCLVGYACGLLADDSDDAEQGHTALFEIVVTAAGAVFGEALAALLSVMLSDPRVTWPAIARVLPVAMLYDVLLCPFVLYAVAAALRLAGVRREDRRAGWSASQARDPAPGAGQGPIRQLAGGNSPRLRMSERDKSPGSIGVPRGAGAGRPVARREPQLKLGRAGQRTSAAAGLGAAFAAGGLGAGASKVRFGGKRREGVLGGSLLGAASPAGAALRGPGRGGSGLGRSALAGSGRGRSALAGSRLGRSLLGGSVFSRPSAALGRPSAALGRPSAALGRPSAALGRPSAALGRPGRPSSPWSRPGLFSRSAVFGRAAPLGRSAPFRYRGRLKRSRAGGLAGTAPRFSRGNPLGRLGGALRRSAGPKSPGRGWLRGTSSRGSLGRAPLGGRSLGGRSPGRGAFGRRRPGRGWAGAGTPRLTAGHRARLRMPRPKAKRRWRRTGGYR